ncbi:MAG: DUF4430 domain-containing protein [Firmicutes bacterium]|nr:DUF4430 domain-containing protein [Bacillota bacterium]
MKRTITAILLAISLLTAFAACGGSSAQTTEPETHVTPYTVTVLVTMPDGTQKTHELTTSKLTLGEALRDYGLVEFDGKGMIITVDGVTADYSADQSYWAFYIGGEYAAHGVDDEILAEGNEYAFEYAKG